MENYRGTGIANFNYLIAIIFFLTISPFSIMPLITGVLYKISSSTFDLRIPFWIYIAVVTLPLIVIWIVKKGLLPVHERGDKLGGVMVIMVANVLLLTGLGFFAYFVSHAKGGGTISGVPFGLWIMILMPLHLIGIALTEWKRWSVEGGSKAVKIIVMLIILAPAVFYISGIFIF